MLDLNCVLSRYCSENHPRVRCREKTADQVREEFAYAIQGKSGDGKCLSKDGFYCYYADVNACLPNEREDHFVDIVRNTWGMVLAEGSVRVDRLKELEMIVFEKIRQKTVGTDNEGSTLRRKFNYVDTFDEGVVDLGQFKMAMEELGCYFNAHEQSALFMYYSKSQPKLSYKDMCDYYKDLGCGAQANLNPAYKEYRKLPENALNQVRKELLGNVLNVTGQEVKSRGYFGISALRRIFARADKNGNGTLDRTEFTWCLRECNINLTKTDYEKIFRYFDQNSDNAITFTEFIEMLREPLTDRKRECIQKAYYTVKQEGALTLNKIAQYFSPLKHPELQAGYRTKNEMLREFLQLFDDMKDSSITLDAWEAVFTDIASSFRTDDDFDKYMCELWATN